MTIFGNLADEITRNKKIVEVIDAINNFENKSEYYDKLLEKLKDSDKFLIEASSILSREELAETNYKSSMIKEYMAKKKAIDTCKDDIYRTFKVDEYYSTADVNKHLTNIFSTHNISINKRGMVDILKNYFEIEETRKSSERGVIIVKII